MAITVEQMVKKARVPGTRNVYDLATYRTLHGPVEGLWRCLQRKSLERRDKRLKTDRERVAANRR